jgi:serine/threonine protein kinase/TolB-like protein/tetratricopeptide (TPR) repeat protein
MSIPPDDWPRVRAVFEHALTLPVSARSDYVAAACTDNTDIRRQVERMLASHAKATSFLETPMAVPLADVTVVNHLEGTLIGPYQLGARLGAGGMGEVYSARDTRLGRTVAVKVLPSHVANDPHARERFDREARAIAALNHPHICVLHDVGEATVAGDESVDGHSRLITVRYLVMELLEGETLATRLLRGPLPLDEGIRHAVEIASALNRAHQAGIVHRDLKPGNVFLVSTGGTSPAFTAKLLDFGLAKQEATPARSADRQTSPDSVTKLADLTGPGMILGTVQYMAPEQIEGAHTDARTDVFAFGLVLFEMLTGRKAFEADSRRSLMVAILDRDPPQLSALQPLAPQWLDHVVRRCLEKNPDNRWQTARDVLLELQAPRGASPAPSPLVADRPGIGTHSQAKLGHDRRPRPVWAAAIVVALAAGVAGSILATRPGREVSVTANGASAAVQKASLAVLPFRSIDLPETAPNRLGIGIADAIVTRLANVPSIRVRPTSAIVSLEGRTIDAVAVAHQLQVDHVLTGTVRRAGDAYRFSLQLVRATDDVLVWGRQIDVSQQSLFTIEDQVSAEVVTALQLQITSTERARLNQPSTQNPDAYSEYLQGRALMANYSDSNLREAMNHFERALQTDQNYGLANAGLAMAAGTFSVRFAYEQQAADWGRRAEEYASRALKQDANLAEAHLALASAAGTLYRNFDWPTVIRESQVALTLNPNLDLAHSALARAFYHIGLLDWSEVEARRATEISGGTNIEVDRVHLYNELLMGHFDRAHQMAESLVKRTNAPAVQQYLGLASFYGGDPVRAQEILTGVRRPDGRPDTRSQASLAGVLAASGRRGDAERTIRGVIDSGYMDHHVAYALGAAAAKLGRPADAVKWLRTAADTGFACYQWMERDTLLDPIRSDQRFQTLLASLRADHERARTRYQAVAQMP